MLPRQVIAKGTTKRSIENRQLPPNLAGDFSANGCQTEATFIRYINEQLVPYLGPEGGALIVDTYAAHMTDAVKMCLNENHIDLMIVPPRMTHALQPLDVGVNALIRKHATKLYLAEQHERKENRDPYGAAAVRVDTGLKQVKPRHIRQAFVDAAQYVPPA